MKRSKIIRGMLMFAGIVLLSIVALALTVALILLLSHWLTINDKSYETTDVADYGIYDQGTNQPEYVTNFIEYFFPEKIEEDFQNVHYEFHCHDVWGTGFEAYLEFTFDSDTRFEQYVQDITGGEELPLFHYDSSFYEYVIQMPGDEKVLDYVYAKTRTADGTAYSISWAQVSKILFCPKENRVIYIAIRVNSEGASDTNFLGTYFRRFNIDPSQYNSTVDTADELPD